MNVDGADAVGADQAHAELAGAGNKVVLHLLARFADFAEAIRKHCDDAGAERRALFERFLDL